MQQYGKEMITYLNEKVSVDDALKNFKNNNIIEANLGINIVSVGFNACGGSNSIALNVKSHTGAYLPKEIFTFLKAGQVETTTIYNASNITAVTQNYAELAFGHARDLNKKISVGAKLKVLLGAGYSKAHVDNMQIYMSDSKWMINQSSSLIGSKGVHFETKPDKEVDKLKFDDFGVAGFGLGLDLGVIYRFNEYSNVSFAITDIGFLSWNNCVSAYNKNQKFEYTGFDKIGIETNPDGSNDFDYATK